MCKVMQTIDGQTLHAEELSTPLLSLSPLAYRDNTGEIESAHATSFDATTHWRQLEHIFNYYHDDVHQWAVSQVGDSCALNKAIATKLEIPHDGCCNLKLALDVNKMMSSPSTKQTLDDVWTTMHECKGSIKNRAMLHRFTSLSAVLPCATRWSGMLSIVFRFNRIRKYLKTVADTDALGLTISRMPWFHAQYNKLAKQLQQIDAVRKALQRKHATLQEYRFFTWHSTIDDRYTERKFWCAFVQMCIGRWTYQTPLSAFIRLYFRVWCHKDS